MTKYIIKPMESEDEINGKGYVHYKSWHETYTGLVDTAYMDRLTLEKCTDNAHKWPDNTPTHRLTQKIDRPSPVPRWKVGGLFLRPAASDDLEIQYSTRRLPCVRAFTLCAPRRSCLLRESPFRRGRRWGTRRCWSRRTYLQCASPGTVEGPLGSFLFLPLLFSCCHLGYMFPQKAKFIDIHFCRPYNCNQK